MRVAYLGPKGTFSEEAAVRFFSKEASLLPQETMADVLQAVSSGKADKGIVPVENSIAGTIDTSIDGLLTYHLFIEADVILPVSLNLVGAASASSEQVRRVVSITAALNQCGTYIRKNQLSCERVSSTAQAACLIKEQNDPSVAAVASKWVADIYQLKLLVSDIQDHPLNHTRFVVISKNSEMHQGEKKTMILVKPNAEYAGMLASVLNVFAALAINLTWIESRPTGKKLGDYHFFIETESGYGSDPMNKAVKILETYGHQVDILGSYSTTLLPKK